MRRKRFSVEQIVGVLKQVEVGVAVVEVCRQTGITEQTFYRWKKQYAGLETDHVRQLKQLQEENARLKRLVAELSLDKTMLQDVLAKKNVKPSRRRPVVEYLGGVYRVSQRRACQVARIPVSTFRYQSTQEPRTALRLRIREIAQARIRYGYRKIRVLLKREGWKVGKKLVYRLYCEEGLALRHKPRRRRCAAANRRERTKATAPNQAWSVDFVADQIADGRKFRALTIVDVFTRESLAIEVGQSLKGTDVVRVLSRIGSQRATPKTLYCDNGTEFTSQVMDLWAYRAGVKIDFSRPGKPTDNAYIESFNGTFRSECLDAHWFATLAEARQVIEAWRHEYNASRPHRALGERTPNEIASEFAASRELTGQQTAENSLSG
ncbi:MAG: IS3 family transposase [Candidatus Acidiferrales bacterium]